MLTRKNHYLHIFCMLTASYLHYKCHKRVLESGSFIFSRWQKNSSLRLFLKTYFYFNNGVLLNNCTNKQIITLRTHLEPFELTMQGTEKWWILLTVSDFSSLYGVPDGHKNCVEKFIRRCSIFSTLRKGFGVNLVKFWNKVALSWRTRISKIKTPETFNIDNFKTL